MKVRKASSSDSEDVLLLINRHKDRLGKWWFSNSVNRFCSWKGTCGCFVVLDDLENVVGALLGRARQDGSWKNYALVSEMKGGGSALLNAVPKPAYGDVSERNQAGCAAYLKAGWEVIDEFEVPNPSRMFKRFYKEVS